MAKKAYSYIRFSTPQQLKGDSLRRQLEESAEFARIHGLQLDTSLRDLAVRAYKGQNLEEGSALARFLTKIEEGSVKRGEWLIIESFDRLSRQNVFSAFTLFGKILEKGITIATTGDGQIYTSESVAANIGQLYVSLGAMTRANDESRTKSDRLRKSWNQRRKNAGTKAITTVCPAWLRPNSDKTGFVIDATRQQLVREMFELRRSGIGKYQIAARFNTRGERPWNPTKRTEDRGTRPRFWHSSYIGRILANRQVIGEFQPYHILDGKRVPSGEPISNYYPGVVSEELFYAVNGTRKLRGGRRSPKESNLFSGLAFCRCRAPMRFADKGEYKYLVCSAANSKAGCRYVSWPYKHFESAFLNWASGPDVLSALTERDDDRLDKLKLALDAATGKLVEIQNRIKALLRFAETGNAPLTITARLRELETEEQTVQNDEKKKRAAFESERRAIRSAEGQAAAIARLIECLKDPGARAKLKAELGRSIQRITVYPDKAPVNSEFRLKLVQQIRMWNEVASRRLDNSEGSAPQTPLSVVNNPIFHVSFQNGKEAVVIPAPPNPKATLPELPLFVTSVLDSDAVSEGEISGIDT